MATKTPVTAISIDVVNDLASTAALKNLLTSSAGAIFGIGGEILQFAGNPVAQAAAAKASASLSLTAPASWTLPNGIVFSLTTSASCAITIDTVSETFAVATTLDATTTTNIVAGPTSGIVYINIDLDFSIQGSATGTGSINGLGVTGTVSGGRSATLSFCQPVDATLSTLDAIKAAFSQIVFPLDPTSSVAMQTGALTRVLFDGTFSAELDVTYGLGDHIFSAPSAGAVLASTANVVSLSSPSIEINAGATGSISYNHTDHYGLIVDKSSSTVATAYLVHTLSNDAGLSAGINVGVTVTAVSVAVDPTALQAVVQQLSGNATLAGIVVNAASQPINNLTSGLNAKLASWATDVSGDIGLTASLDRQTNRTALYVFDADLTSSALATSSWTALIAGNISQALAAGGLTLQPGSGVSESLKRASTIQFQFFNFFKSTTVTDFFSNASAELGPDGTIRLHASIGDETGTTTQKTLSAFRIYFVVSASQNAGGGVSVSEVDLRVELSEAAKQRSGATFADTLALTPSRPVVVTAQQAIASYLGGHPNGNLTLVYNIKPSAFSNLTFNPPGPLPHAADQSNWEAFQSATLQLISNLNVLISPLGFGNWVTFNQASIDEPGSTIAPDRRQIGAIANGVATLSGTSAPQVAGFFMLASQGFMNLCEDLSNLATSSAQITDLSQYNSLLSALTQVINQDVFIQYGVPTAAALVRQLGLGSANIVNSLQQATDGSSLTSTITIS